MPRRDMWESSGVSSGAEAAGETRLSGWLLFIARAVAYSVVAVTVGLGIIALLNWPRLARPCADALNSCLLTPEQVAPLARLGITPTGLALGVVLLCLMAIGLANGVAALLLWRRSDDAMALLVAVTLVLLPAFFTPMYQSLMGGWLAAARGINALGGIFILLLLGLFPSGRFAPRWIGAPLVALVFVVSDIGGLKTRLPAPLLVLIPVAAVICLAGGQIYRYRRVSTPIQRQQTKWAVTGIVLAVLTNQLFWQPDAWIPALSRKDSLYPLLLYPDFVLLISVLAICFGVAILRYRLYDVDLIIKRTLLYGALTAILAAVYFAIVLGAQALTQRLAGMSGRQPLITVITTLLVVALFTPLRRWLQTLIDRAFYRSRYDAARTIEAFGGALRHEVDLEGLSERLVAVAQATMQPAHAHLWLRPPRSQDGKTPADKGASPP
ncbi:MAG TPA: hypothetical protein VF808_03400 [Ktedonobacterales bacterium]